MSMKMEVRQYFSAYEPWEVGNFFATFDWKAPENTLLSYDVGSTMLLLRYYNRTGGMDSVVTTALKFNDDKTLRETTIDQLLDGWVEHMAARDTEYSRTMSENREYKRVWKAVEGVRGVHESESYPSRGALVAEWPDDDDSVVVFRYQSEWVEV